jgi:regulator of replication initiation timing
MGVEELVKENRKLKKENKKLKEKLSKREQWEYRYFWNDGEQDLYEDVK